MSDVTGGFSRRAVLSGLIAAPFVLRPAEAASNARGVAMRHLVTKETIAATYWRNGKYDSGAWKELNEFLRDTRTGEAIMMDLRTIDIVHAVSEKLGAGGKAEILCGYRSAKSNAVLRRKTRGVAKNSYHVSGRAIDFRVPGKNLRFAQRIALSLKSGGVGYYARSRFIHVDNGPIRAWRG